MQLVCLYSIKKINVDFIVISFSLYKGLRIKNQCDSKPTYSKLSSCRSSAFVVSFEHCAKPLLVIWTFAVVAGPHNSQVY